MPEARVKMQARVQPPDHAERRRALDPAGSFLVQAPAGSGKTYLLTQRFLRLLAEAERPDEIVAITFTNAAAAEMRNRILEALERAEQGGEMLAGELAPDSLEALARRALERSRLLGWQILDQPGQLRVTTIDAFCRGLALQSPLSWGLLAGLGGRLETVEKADELYRHAARRTLEHVGVAGSAARPSVEALLLWRDNNWKDVEDLIVQMLAQRNRWHQEFVFAREVDWDALRQRLEAPFRRAVRQRLGRLRSMLDRLPGCCDFALELARAACETAGRFSPLSLAERVEFPDFTAGDEGVESMALEDAVCAYRELAGFLLTSEGAWRKKGGLNLHYGFPATPTGSALKQRMAEFVEALAQEPGLEAALSAFQKPLPVSYSDEEWALIRHCFAVLRVAAAELQLVFAESGSVDFAEVAQIALRILAPENGYPSDFALRQADAIHHLLIDEFQDTSRNQHQLLARLIGAWPDTSGRSCFCVGDPMQSIYGFREAEVELFERLKTHGLEISDAPDAVPFRFEFLQLQTNFRSAPSLVEDLNGHFAAIFGNEAAGDGVQFAAAVAVRARESAAKTELHLAFTRSTRGGEGGLAEFGVPEQTRRNQQNEVVGLIQDRLQVMAGARAEYEAGVAGDKYRIAVLGRTRAALLGIAEALSAAGIGFRAVDLVRLRERPEVLDALSLARALINPVDRTAWLGVLRAPWCGLSLAELHLLTAADDAVIVATPVPVLLATRLPALYESGRLEARAFRSATRVERVLRRAIEGRAGAGEAALGTTLGTWLASVWAALGGGDTVNDEQRQNLRLLWAALDKLPEGELGLLGPALHAALDDLYAQPDPAASSDFGVQLMTIHKSKGLEFEVVIVPDLETASRQGERTMISWLERGLSGAEPGDAGLTEFLIAPIQSKGAEAGTAKQWVDAVKAERERQELRRVLYVAATRAREELHLFARPRFGVGKAKETRGALTLGKSTGLLATAWPALAAAVEARFAAWVGEMEAAETEEAGQAALGRTLETLAAEAGNLLMMPLPGRPTLLRRLPEDYAAPESRRRTVSSSPSFTSSPSFPSFSASDRLSLAAGENDFRERALSYARTEGGLRSRLEGTAIHAFLEEASRLRQKLSHEEAMEALGEALPGVIAMVRSRGLALPVAEKLVHEALMIARRTLADPVGAWILTPHAQAAAESRWTGLVHLPAAPESGLLRNLRPDRVFFAAGAGADSGLRAEGDGWWIIDYKTSHAPGLHTPGLEPAAGAGEAKEAEREHFKRTHRAQHVDQLAAYAELLRGLRQGNGGIEEIRAGLYYPRLQLFDWWPV